MQITKYNIELDEECKAILVKEDSRNCTTVHDLCSPIKIKMALDETFRASFQAEEHSYLIALTVKCKPIGIFEISHGTAQECFMNSREIFVRLCLCGAVNFIVVHNHPSGDCTPSTIDIQCTNKLADAAKLMKIPLIDHIIIAPKDIYSFREHGLL